MKVVNLLNTSKHRINTEINAYVGGKSIESYWLTGFQKGMGGFSFRDPALNDEAEKFLVSIAFFNHGIGIYCRNIYNNYLLLIRESDIKSLEIKKEEDIIAPLRFSPYVFLKRMGISDHTASKYLIPREIIQENPVLLIVKTNEKYLQLHLEKISHDKLISTVRKANFEKYLNIDIKSNKILNQ